MNITIYIAIYGAGLSTALAIFEFYKWWTRGPKLVGTATANMRMVGGGVIDDNFYVSLMLSNRGNAETTITGVTVKCYGCGIKWRHGPVAVVNRQMQGYALPYKLREGGEFRCLFEQTPQIEEWSRKYRTYLCVWHSMSDKPKRFRLQPIPPATEGQDHAA
jgi:hypothetical protein